MKYTKWFAILLVLLIWQRQAGRRPPEAKSLTRNAKQLSLLNGQRDRHGKDMIVA